jgi:Ca2+-binding EF-hand superfamily protein
LRQREAVWQTLFSESDANKDSKLDEAEHILTMGEMVKSSSPEELKVLQETEKTTFDSLDIDQDGHLAYDEFAHKFNGRHDANEMMQRLDANGDSLLNADELETGRSDPARALAGHVVTILNHGHSEL